MNVITAVGKFDGLEWIRSEIVRDVIMIKITQLVLALIGVLVIGYADGVVVAGGVALMIWSNNFDYVKESKNDQAK